MPTKCVCLRSREIRAEGADAAKARLFRHRYYANKGEEWFLSFETPDRSGVYGFLKLRFNSRADQVPERLPAGRARPRMDGGGVV